MQGSLFSGAVETIVFKGVFKEWRYHKVLYIVHDIKGGK